MQATTSVQNSLQRILVVGATGGTGRATVKALLVKGYEVTAFSRSASRLAREVGPGPDLERLTVLDGDVMNPEDVSRAVAGQDAVIVTLGITENPLRVRLFGPARTPLDVRSQGTKNVVAAMRAHGVERLIVQSSFGVGDTRDRLGLADRLFFSLLLRPQIDDTEVQEIVVRDSALDWTIAQPVHLSDAQDEDEVFTSLEGDTRNMTVSRNRVGRFLAQALDRAELRQSSVAISG